MRIGGSSLFAVLAAAVGVWLVGFLIFAVAFSDLWLSLQDTTKDAMTAEAAGQEWRMALSPVMPLVLASGLAIVMGWRGKTGLMAGVQTGLFVALFFLIAARLYGFVYSTEHPGLLAMDAAHFLLDGVIAGAILGAWPQKKV